MTIKKITFLVLIFGLLFPLGKVFAITPNIISTQVNPGVTVAIFEGSVNPGGMTTTAWFEYGTSESLNNFKETVHLHIGSSTFETPIKTSVTGLDANTTYYFRLASDNGQSTAKGKTYSFKTLKDEYLTNTEENTKSENNNDFSYDSTKEFEIVTKNEKVHLGEEVEFLVTFRNKTNRAFEDTRITVELPKGIEFVESNFGKEDNNSIILDVETLIPDQIGSLTVKGVVTNEAEGKDLLVTTAVMTYKVKGSENKEERVDYVKNELTTEINLSASSANFDNNSFLPRTLLDWLTLILVISGLILVGKNLYRDIPSQKVEKH